MSDCRQALCDLLKVLRENYHHLPPAVVEAATRAASATVTKATAPAPSKGSTCRSCGAAVIWCVTEKGKRMPVDATPAQGGNIVLEPANATMQRGGQPLPPLAKYVGAGRGDYTSHFTGCPGAKTWRKE